MICIELWCFYNYILESNYSKTENYQLKSSGIFKEYKMDIRFFWNFEVKRLLYLFQKFKEKYNRRIHVTLNAF